MINDDLLSVPCPVPTTRLIPPKIGCGRQKCEGAKIVKKKENYMITRENEKTERFCYCLLYTSRCV